MVTTVLSIMLLIVSLYLIGSPVRQNNKVDQVITLIEGGYKNLNQNLRNIEVQATLQVVSNFCSQVLIVTFLGIIASSIVTDNHTVKIILGGILVIATLIKQSIQSILNHKKALATYAQYAAIAALAPIGLLWIGGDSGLPLFPENKTTLTIASFISDELTVQQSLAIAMSIMMTVSVLIMYLLSTIVSIITFTALYIIIWSAKITAIIVEKFAPINNLQGLSVIIFTVLTLIIIFSDK